MDFFSENADLLYVNLRITKKFTISRKYFINDIEWGKLKDLIVSIYT